GGERRLSRSVEDDGALPQLARLGPALGGSETLSGYLERAGFDQLDDVLVEGRVDGWAPRRQEPLSSSSEARTSSSRDT
ncbi:MAG: hypothetical protein AAGA56_26720, partial [Myxococcota bacterium]